MIHESKFVKGKFQMEISDRFFPGFHQPDVHWNGWDCPYFTLKVAKQILEECYKMNRIYDETCVFKYKIENGVIHILDYPMEKENEMICEPVVVDGKTLYALGSWCWCWTEKNHFKK